MNGHQVLVTIDRTNLDNLWTLHICTIISWHLSYLSFTSYYSTLQCKHMKQYLKRTAPLSKLSYKFTRQLLPLSSNSVELSTATLADQKHLLQPPSDVFNVSWRRSIQLGFVRDGWSFQRLWHWNSWPNRDYVWLSPRQRKSSTENSAFEIHDFGYGKDVCKN